MMTSDFAGRVRGERRRLGLSQTEFAALGGVKLGSQNGYENGKQSPSITYLGRLANSGIDIQYLVTGDRSGALLDPQEAALIEAYRTLTEELRALLRQTAETFSRQAPVLPDAARSRIEGVGYAATRRPAADAV